jgi:hypothetical protein
MKTINVISIFKSVTLLTLVVIILTVSCKKPIPDNPDSPDSGAIQGAPGNPRFNLQFTNGTKTDLDLYVSTPSGAVISYTNQYVEQGQLDVDCLCGACPNGPNENIYWVPGTAPKGTYKVWVVYYGDCDGSGASSDYTLRIMNNSNIIQTYTGTLSGSNYQSPVYTYNFQ